jgi:hypothetical protein
MDEKGFSASFKKPRLLLLNWRDKNLRGYSYLFRIPLALSVYDAKEFM